ncbi:MAG: hypothetical protein ACE5HE_03155 [Phycisphaerae bacterium]
MRLVVIACAAYLCAGESVARGDLPYRTRDPVVLIGADLEAFLGLPVDGVLAYRYDNGWEQIPLQVDERAEVDFGVAYGLSPIGFTTLAYTDPATFTGADPDTAFDANDELVFMARDTGARVAAHNPAPPEMPLDGATEVEIRDPLTNGVSYVYLFRTGGAMPSQPTPDYVGYSFNLLSGDYLTTYDTLVGPNPEDSVVVSSHYRTHFSDRWIRDDLNVFADDSTGVDILDRHTNLFAPDTCERSEDTFSAGEGAFLANKDGPIRAIRSYLGANSGPLTQRDHFFYDQRHDIVTALRVHQIPGMMDLYDYSPAAAGMTYYNDLNTTGVLIDGLADTLVPGGIVWEMATGAQGSLVVTHLLETDIGGFVYTSYYQDDDEPLLTPCTGDPFRYATSGTWVNTVTGIPNTDPLVGPFNTLSARRIVYCCGPGLAPADATLLHRLATTPFVVVNRPWSSRWADVNGDCHVDTADYARLATCASGPAACGGDGCEAFDRDGDCAVTLRDFAEFQFVFTGDDYSLPDCGR